METLFSHSFKKHVLVIVSAFCGICFMSCKKNQDIVPAIVYYHETADFIGVNYPDFNDGKGITTLANQGFFALFTIDSIDNSRGTSTCSFNPQNFYVIDQRRDKISWFYMITSMDTAIKIPANRSLVINQKIIIRAYLPSVNVTNLPNTAYNLSLIQSTMPGNNGFILVRKSGTPKAVKDIYNFEDIENNHF